MDRSSLTSRRNCMHLISGAMIAGMLPTTARAQMANSQNFIHSGLGWDDKAGLVKSYKPIAALQAGTVAADQHLLRESMWYAEALLANDQSPPSVARAIAIIEKVLPFQDTDPSSPHYGTWPYYAEEPLSKMPNPDDNWAEFFGASLCDLLIDQSGVLPPDLQTRMRAALTAACMGIIKHNVQPSYTNIAVMAARVTLIAGQILNRPDIFAFGSGHLANILAYTRQQGSFNEYNSPTYTFTALEGLDAILTDVRDRSVKSNAHALWMVAWDMISSHYHPGTGEWAGPHSRAYSDRLENETKAQIALRTGLPLPSSDVPPVPTRNRILPCPPAMHDRFYRLAQPTVFEQQKFSSAPDPRDSIVGTTWLVNDACLGSASFDSFWVQTHAIIGYWRGDTKAAVFKVRVLKDGKDFASFGVRTTQSGSTVLMAASPLANRGATHPTLDKSPTGFAGNELRLRFSLDGDGATAQQLDGGFFELVSGGWKAVVQAGEMVFDGQTDPGQWQTGNQGGIATVDYVIPLSGHIKPETLASSLLSAGISVVPAGARANLVPITAHAHERGWHNIRMGDQMSVAAPNFAR